MGNVEATLDELVFDLSNPRFDGLANQREALEKIVVTQGSKLVNLAEDIVNEGMSPAHRMLVMPVKGKKATWYTVMDGNRRLAALRILANPSVLDGMTGVGDQTARNLRKLSKEFRLTDVEPLDVFVCKTEEQARHWIEAIHTGENDGRGVVAWDGIATARYRGKNLSLKILDFVKAAGKLAKEELTSLERFPITNLDRLLGTSEVRDRLGLSLENGDLTSDLPQTEVLRPLRRIVLDLATRKIKVGEIKSKDDRISYVQGLGADLPDLSKRTGNSEPLDRISAHAQAKNHAKSSTASTSRSLLDRKALIPAQTQCHLNITDHKLQQMCKELRKLSLDTYPVAIAASFRVFLELTLDHYADGIKLSGYNNGLALKQKILAVDTALQGQGLTKRDLQSFRALANNQNVALSIDRLNGVIHSRYTLPTASELRSGWSEIQLVFTTIWA